MFKALEKIGYLNYLKKHPFHIEIGIDLNDYLKSGLLEKKRSKSQFESVDFKRNSSISAELDDLIRLHYLITSRKVTTILEFGLGYSTKVMDHALDLNKKMYKDIVFKDLRRSNPFELHTIDSQKNGSKQLKILLKQRILFIIIQNVILHFLMTGFVPYTRNFQMFVQILSILMHLMNLYQRVALEEF